jgi:hypothetical protein
MDRTEAAALIIERLDRALDAPHANKAAIASAVQKVVLQTLKDFEDDVRFSESMKKDAPVMAELRRELNAAREERDRANDLYWSLKNSLKGDKGHAGRHAHGRNGSIGNGNDSEAEQLHSEGAASHYRAD